jgi:hypothetical protein
MNVCCRHENGNLDPFVFEIFSLNGSFNDNNFPVGRRNNEIFTLVGVPLWRTEKAHYHQEKPKAKDIEKVMEPGLHRKNMINSKENSNNKEKYYDYGLVTFTVYRHPGLNVS